MRRLVVALALVAISAPAASACSLAEEPAWPARVWTWEIEARQAVLVTDLFTRGLGADCSLLAAADIDAERLVVADRAGTGRGVWLHEIGSEVPPRLVFRLDGVYAALDLEGDMLFVQMSTYRQAGGYYPERIGHLFAVNLSSGDVERLAVEAPGRARLGDGLLAWDHVSADGAVVRHNVLDLVQGQWLYQNVSAANAFGLDSKVRMLEAGREWMLLRGDTHDFAFDQRAGTLHQQAERFPWGRVLDGDLLYWLGGSSYNVQALPHGAPVDLPAPDEPFLGRGIVRDGYVLLGHYSVDGGPRTPPTWMTEPADTWPDEFDLPAHWRHQPPPGIGHPLPAGGLGLLLPALGLALLAMRARR